MILTQTKNGTFLGAVLSLLLYLSALTILSNFPLCAPSQNGLFFARPHLQSENVCFVVNLFPSPSTNSTSPVTRKEPLSFTLIVAN